MNQEITTILVAALAGLITAFVIEAFKEINERRKIQEELKRKNIADLRSFLTAEQGNSAALRPVARLLVSTAYKRQKIAKIASEYSREITSVKEVTVSIIPKMEISKTEALSNKKRLLFFNRPPATTTPVHRTYYRSISSNRDWAEAWETRDRAILLGAVTTIGRYSENDLVLSHTLISRHHAVIRYEDNGYVIYDISITNPVEVNDEAIKQCRLLKDGDVIEIGAFLIEFQQRDPKLETD